MRHCEVCRHEKRLLIEDARLRNISCQTIADSLRDDPVPLSLDQIWRHMKHMDRQPVVVLDTASASIPLVDRVENLVRKSEAIASAATGEKSWPAATGALREARCCLELLAKLTGQLTAGGTNVRVGVALSVTTPQATSTLSESELEQRIALEVFEATNGFDLATIDRLRRLAEGGAGNAILTQENDTELTHDREGRC